MGQRRNSFNGTNRPVRIILADDHQIVRQGLRILLEAEPDMEIIAEADNGRKVLKQAQELLPDVIIMDLSMPELNGIEATRQILSGSPGGQGDRPVDALRQPLCAQHDQSRAPRGIC